MLYYDGTTYYAMMLYTYNTFIIVVDENINYTDKNRMKMTRIETIAPIVIHYILFLHFPIEGNDIGGNGIEHLLYFLL